jgi:hypothetical protein
VSLLKASRRQFLKSTAVAASLVGTSSLAPSSVLGANDRLNVGILGMGGKGFDHLNWLQQHVEEENVRVTAEWPPI